MLYSRLARLLLISKDTALTEQAKPIERWGRKATGPRKADSRVATQ